jgi:hypothetical protein
MEERFVTREEFERLQKRVAFLENLLLNPIFPEEKDRQEAFIREFGDLLREFSVKFEGLRKELERLGLKL